jgi:septal ring factor EnvC (AmiA/AmiB activator)
MNQIFDHTPAADGDEPSPPGTGNPWSSSEPATIPAPPPELGAIRAGPVAGGPPKRGAAPWVTITVAVVAALAVAFGAVLAVSRASISSDLSTTRARLAASTSDLTAAQAQTEALDAKVADLGQQVADLGDDQARATSDLAESNRSKKDAQEALAACRHFLDLSADLFDSNRNPNVREQARLAADLVSCYEGKVPPAFFP